MSYENGVESFKFGDDTGNNLWLNQENMYFVDEDEVENIYNQVKDLEAYSFEGKVVIDPALDVGDKIIIDERPVIYQGEADFQTRFIAQISSKISIKQKQETTVKTTSQKVLNRRVQSRIDEVEGKITTLVEETDKNSSKLTQVVQDIDGITQTVSSVEEQVDETNQNISQTNQKVTQIEQTVEGITQTVDDVQTNIDENYSTTEEMNSAIEQKAGSITSSVTKSIEDIQVGGTNLIRNSAPYNMDNWVAFHSTTSIIEDTSISRKCIKMVLKKNTDNLSGVYNTTASYLTLERNKQYSVSMWLKGSKAMKVLVRHEGAPNQYFDITTDWKKYSYKFVCGEPNKNFIIYAKSPNNGDILYAHSVKLEEGNKVTSWSPAPEDDVKEFEFGTKIVQDWESVQIAWNQISQYIQFINAMLQIKDSNNTLLMTLDRYGQKFYENNVLLGMIGSTFYTEDNSQKGLAFNLEPNGKFMTWGKKDNVNDDAYLAKMFYCAPNSFGRNEEGIYFNIPIFLSDELNLLNGTISREDGSWWPAVIINDNIKDGFVRLSRYQCSFDVEDAVYIKGYQVQTNTSDGRLKHNIKNADINGIDRIKQLKHRKFIWNEDNKQEQIGYIAQELEQVDENYVTKNPQYDENGNVIDNLYQVNLLPILATATKAIAELEEKLEEKEKIINKQQEFLSKLAEKVGLQDEYNTFFNSPTPKMAKAKAMNIDDTVDYGTEIKRSTNFKRATPNRLIITKDGTVRKENDNESNT